MEESEQPRFEQAHQPPHLAGGRAQEAQQSKLCARSITSKQRPSHAHDRHEYSDGLQGVSDGEGAVEDADALFPQVAIRQDEDWSVADGSLDGAPPFFEIDTGLQIESQVRWSRSGRYFSIVRRPVSM